ncbi:putative transcriptional regulator [Brevundimonas sp. 1080]|uniref:MucR family transcriptional regulator n=1 Tax=Brevundimonas sp. 1080 TaxID=3156405 RepID=UPI0033957F3A
MVDIVVAYLANTKIDPAEVPQLIGAPHAALVQLTVRRHEEKPDVAREKPNRVAIRKSVTPDGIISFLDGKTYRALKRHLSTRGYTPASYREAFGLPDDYPIVAPAYSAVRSAHAKANGLGAKPNTGAVKATGKRKP